MSDPFGQERAVLGREPGHELTAAVALVHLRLDALCRRVGAHVHVSAQADCGAGRARQRREDVAVPGQLDVVEADLAQLLGEEPREVELLRRARIRVGVGTLLRLGVDAYIPEEALEHVGRQLLGERR